MLISQLLNPLNDVTTTYPHEPQFNAISAQRQGVDYSYRGDNYGVQKKLHPLIKPLQLVKPPLEVFRQVVDLISNKTGWAIVNIDEKNMRIEATCTTRVMRYKDDVAIEVRVPVQPNEKVKSEIHMRSKSRVGKSDLGANAKRIQSFFDLISKY